MGFFLDLFIVATTEADEAIASSDFLKIMGISNRFKPIYYLLFNVYMHALENNDPQKQERLC